MLEDLGFVDVAIGPPVDTFGGARGEGKARTYDVHGYAFAARKPLAHSPDDGHNSEVIRQGRA